MNALKSGSLKPSNWSLNPFDQQNVTLYSHQKQKKNFNTYEDLSLEIIWISSEQVCFKLMSKWFLYLE